MVVGFRTAFTLIELIFAIVIIAISVVSLPMLSQATSSGVGKNLETQEAIFKALVLTKSAVADNNFTKIDDLDFSLAKDIAIGTGLQDYKFPQKYTLTITNPATFGTDTNASIKKITTKIFAEDGTTLLASFSAYKFNY